MRTISPHKMVKIAHPTIDADTFTLTDESPSWLTICLVIIAVALLIYILVKLCRCVGRRSVHRAPIPMPVPSVSRQRAEHPEHDEQAGFIEKLRTRVMDFKNQ